jgi:peptide/nickel transport system permease protein
MADNGPAAGASPAAATSSGGLPRWVRPLGRQVSSVAVTLLGLMALAFFIGRMLPLDPVIAIVGEQAEKETYDMVYRQLGLDKPIWQQFLIFMRDMMTGDFGNALFTGNRVADDLARVFPATIELATFAIIIGVGIGVPTGVLSAVYRDSLLDHITRFVGLLGYSSPNFWLGLMGLIVFYAWLGWVGGPGRLDVMYMDMVEPVTGMLLLDALMAGEMDVFWDAFGHIVMPGTILGYSSMAYISRMTRSFMLEQLSQEYVTAARVKGQSRWRVVWRHAFRNILVQLITVIALAYAFLLEGAVLTETVFAWPGFGRYLTSGILAGDMNAVLACVLIIGVIFVALNLLSDLLYRMLDPRTR